MEISETANDDQNKAIHFGVFDIDQAAASSLNNDYIIKKMAFNGFVRSAKESLFRNMTVYDYLWNYTSPSLENIRSLFPFMVPTDNNGVLYQVRIDGRFFSFHPHLVDIRHFGISIISNVRLCRCTKDWMIVTTFASARNIKMPNFSIW